MANIDEKMLKEFIKETLNELNRSDCNTPIIREGNDSVQLDGVLTVVPKWNILFSCARNDDENDRQKIEFEIEVPSGKSEVEIKKEVSDILKHFLDKK